MTDTDSRIVPLAFPWPVAFAFVAFVALAATLGGGFFEAMKEGGIYAWLLLPLSFFACAAASGVVGAGLPRALALGLAAVPWIAGIGASALNMSKVLAAIASVDVAVRLEILGEGTAEVLVTRVMGSAWSAGAFLGLALSFALRKPKDGAGAFVGAGLAFAAFGLALTSLLTALALRFGLHVSSVASPADRAMVLGAAVAAMAQLKLLGPSLAVIGVLAAVAALAVSKQKVVDAVIAALLLPLLVIADDAPLAQARASLSAMKPPWSDLAGFAPAHFRGGPGEGRIDAYTTTTSALIAPDGTTLDSAHDGVEASSKLKSLRSYLVVGLAEKASSSSIDLAVHTAVLAMEDRIHFVGASAAPSGANDGVTDPLLRAFLAPAVAGREVDVPCASSDVVTHTDGIKAAIDAHPERVCLVLAPFDDGAKVAAALDDLAEAGVHVAFGPPPAPPPAPIEDTLGLAGSVATPRATPTDDKAAIKRVVSAHAVQVRFCYEKALAKNPSLAGKVMLEFTIAVDGTVSDVKADGVDAAVNACIARYATGWRFPERASPTAVRFPFVLRSAD